MALIPDPDSTFILIPDPDPDTNSTGKLGKQKNVELFYVHTHSMDGGRDKAVLRK